jgi:tetratricopeptide (TPR) repeat protein
VREIYTAQLEKAVNEIDFHQVVDGILANLNDSDWVKEIYAGLEERADSSDDYVRLARAVLDKLGDDQWSGKLFDQAKEAGDSTAGCAAVAIALQDSLGDTERAIAVFTKAQSLSSGINDYEALFRTAARRSEFSNVVQEGLKAAEQNLSGALDLRHLAECVLNYTDDRQWARRIYQKALEAPNASRRRSDIILSIKNSLGDEAWASKLYRQP